MLARSSDEWAYEKAWSINLNLDPSAGRAHALPRPSCVPAYNVEWHLRQSLRPMLFDDDKPIATDAARPLVASPAQRSLQR